MIKYLRAVCIALAAIVYSSLAMAQAQTCQWNYYFDGSGNAHASYCGTIDWSPSSTVPLASITGFGANVASWLITPTSANLAVAVPDKTGTGALVFANGPAINLINATCPTRPVGDNSNACASTAFVDQNAPAARWISIYTSAGAL